VLAKTEVGTQRLQTVLYALCECLRYIAVLVAPSCPKRPRRLSQSGWQTTR
jgi:methionyl-tRNA synthetase